MINEKTIWNSKQNHPELVVQDCVKEFNLNESQADKLRFILMNRGVNKWLYARRQFIKLKHKVKERKKYYESTEDHIISRMTFYYNVLKDIRYIQAKMQNIANTPRWVEWGKHIHKNMKNNDKEIIIKGRHC